MLLSIVLLAVLASAQGRAVNISNTWVLPEEGFPVFYRYFRDRISWYEADAVCQFHHANLVTVDTTAQYDAVRAYLKELDISSAVWVGLIRSNPDGDFTWTDYRGLSGEGYWSSAPDARSAPLCAAADPAADYRWEARACGGPTVASFICELPVPQWALGNEGCMVRALPALTILYLPESAAVQLTADCGMAGVKKVQCTGNVKRDDLLQELSCAVEDELTTGSMISTGSYWPVTTDTVFTDQDITNEVTTDETITTKHEVDINQPRGVTETSLPYYIYSQSQYKAPIKAENSNKLNNLFIKNINLEDDHDNNLHSNFIPKTVNENNVLTNDELEKLEDERHKQHKMLHEEIARVGNVDNIFTQPTDHFIPPLVMAKAKISDDMTVLSLAEKHAQQLAEKQFSKQTLNNAAVNHYYSDNHYTSSKTSMEDNDKPLIVTKKPNINMDSKQEILKHHTPKKYMNEKYNDVKLKTSKLSDAKLVDSNKHIFTPISSVTATVMTTGDMETSTSTKKIYVANNTKASNYDDDIGMDLKVMLNDSPLTSEEKPSFSGDVPKLETIQNSKIIDKEIVTEIILTTTNKEIDVTTAKSPFPEKIATQHDIIKITVISDDKLNNTTVSEVSTNMPVFKDNITSTFEPFLTTHINEFQPEENKTIETEEIKSTTTETSKITATTRQETINPMIDFTSTISTNPQFNKLTTAQAAILTTEIKSSTETATTEKTKEEKHFEETEIEFATTSLPITLKPNNTNLNNTKQQNLIVSTESVDKVELNSSEFHEMLNVTDHQDNEGEESTEGDFQSPLLSGVMEPMHRPPRMRRPNQPPRNKFNPFRILG